MTKEERKAQGAELIELLAKRISESDNLVEALKKERDAGMESIAIVAVIAKLTGDSVDPIQLLEHNFNLFIRVLELREQSGKGLSSTTEKSFSN